MWGGLIWYGLTQTRLYPISPTPHPTPRSRLIPKPGVAFWVIFCVLLSVINTLGFLHWWGVTISVVSSVYVLISVGLAVDYSAHIAHVFVISTGTAKERAIKALMRIGPSVFNAVMSTFLAVVCISFSKSYVFRVFFKALALVTVIGGMHGLWLLPVLLVGLGWRCLIRISAHVSSRDSTSVSYLDANPTHTNPTTSQLTNPTQPNRKSIFGGERPEPGNDSPRDSQIAPSKQNAAAFSNGESKEAESKSADPAEIEMAEVRRREQSVHV